MSKSAKVLVTIGAIFLYIIIATPIMAAMKESGQSSGFIGLILLVALIGAIRAIWKKPKNEGKKDDDENNSSVLQK
jgi:Na+/melibiose symporter-like transporter